MTLDNWSIFFFDRVLFIVRIWSTAISDCEVGFTHGVAYAHNFNISGA